MATNDPLGNEPPIPPPHGTSEQLSATPSEVAYSESATERNWDNAPKPVKFARILAVVEMVGSAYLFLQGLLSMGGTQGIIVPVYFCVMGGLFLLVHFWLFGALKEGEPEAWNLQRFVSILGLCICPVGTIVYGILLTQWSDDSVKRWFARR